jgi:hypothetical protein
VELLDIDDAYVRFGSVVAVIDCAMSAFSDSNEYISMLESIQHAQTGSYDDANIDDVDTVEPFKKLKTIDNNEIYMNDLVLVSLAFIHGEV